MKEKIENLIKEALEKLDLPSGTAFAVERPAEMAHGDWASNVALAIPKEGGKNPREIAEKIANEIEKKLPRQIEKISVAGPGFINFHLKREYFLQNLKEILEEGEKYGRSEFFAGKKVVVEYTQPNILKPLHIGHLMSNTIGESISRLVEAGGAETKRVNYQGDVGLHIAKAIWGMKQLGGEMPAEDDSLAKKSEFLGNAYVHGASAYEENPKVKEEIDELNIRINKGGDEEIRNLYDVGRRWSLEHFEEIYKIVGTKFDRYYFESETAPIGEKIVRDNVGEVFEKGDGGAIVYKGEKKGLHTRVFITGKGIPLYEAKELALPKMKFDEFGYDISVVITAEEQKEYFKVVLAALSEITPELSEKIRHIIHGMMQLTTGKMSSRKGNVITGESLLKDTIIRVREIIEEREDIPEEDKERVSKQVAVSAIKYAILKQSSGKNIIYDEKKALSFEGDSGPYLQYTHARIASLLEKARSQGIWEPGSEIYAEDASEAGQELEKLLERFPETVLRAQEELEPHHISNYIAELAGAFNSFYGKEKIIDKDDSKSLYKLSLSQATAHVLKNGLLLLGIEAPDRM